MENAVLVSYSVSMFSISRTDKKISREVLSRHEVSSRAGRFVKNLIDNREPLYRAICAARDAGRQTHYAYTLPWADGVRLLNTNGLDAYRDEMQKVNDRFQLAVNRFVFDWPRLVADAQNALGDMFKATDYPDAMTVGSFFDMSYSVLPLPRDNHFDNVAELVGSELAQELAGELTKQNEAHWAEATKSVWQRLFDTLSHAQRQLSFGERLHPSVMGNLQELSDLLPVLNVNNDVDLESRRKELNSVLAMYSTESIKDKDNRKSCASEVSTILNKLKF